MDQPELLFLHALPLDGSMWDAQQAVIPFDSLAPTLYGLGETLTQWAEAALSLTQTRNLVLVGCSVGGSCALEVAHLAPERVAGMVLVGTKADHRADPSFQAEAVRVIREEGRDAAWRRYWRPLFDADSPHAVTDAAYRIMMRQSEDDLVRGIDAFHARRSRADILAGLSCPVAVVTGEHDPAPGLTISCAQAGMAANGSLHVIKSSGHYVPLEKPADLNRLLNAFVKACR